MNIHVVRPDGSWYSRPDITLVRDADRFCLPDDCPSALAVHGCCIRIGKAGKAVETRFAGRYADGWTDAVLFYGRSADGTVTPYLDRATQVDRTFHGTDTLDTASLQRALDALVRISRHLSLRIGDFLILETDAPAELRAGDFFDNIAIL